MTNTAVERYEDHRAPTGLTMPNDREFAALEKLADRFAKSGLLLPHFKDRPDAVLAAALTCWSTDMPVNLPTLNQFYEVNGKIQPGTQFCVALGARHGIEIWFDDASDDTHAIAYGRRAHSDRVHRYEFTWEMAKKAGLTTKDNWKHPEIMLRYRAASRLMRTSFPETLMGLPPSALDEGIDPVDRATLEANAIDVLEHVDPETGEVVGDPADSAPDAEVVDAELVDDDVMPQDWRDRFVAGCTSKLWPDDDTAAAKRAALVAYATGGRTDDTDQIVEGEKVAVETAFRGVQSAGLTITEVDGGWVVSKAGEEPF